MLDPSRPPAIWIGGPWRCAPGSVRLLAVTRHPVPELLEQLGARRLIIDQELRRVFDPDGLLGDVDPDREWRLPIARAGELRRLAAEIETRWLGGSWELAGLQRPTTGLLGPLRRLRPEPVTAVGTTTWEVLRRRATDATEGGCWVCGHESMLVVDVAATTVVRPVPVLVVDASGTRAELRCEQCDAVERCAVDATVDLDDASSWMARLQARSTSDVRTELERARRDAAAPPAQD